MATNVILPALGMAQETGIIVQWLKSDGAYVSKGEPLAEIETDKATVEIEAPATGVLTNVSAVGAEVPVGQVIAMILGAGEMPATETPLVQAQVVEGANSAFIPTSSLASRIAAEHNVDLSQIKPAGRRIQKADVLTYLQGQGNGTVAPVQSTARLVTASPKARRLAREYQQNLATMQGTGPEGAILAADVLKVQALATQPQIVSALIPTPMVEQATSGVVDSAGITISNTWRVMAERTTQSWTSVPHFFLLRDVQASRLITWREQIVKRASTEKVTYSDLLVKIVGMTLRQHPRINATWSNGSIHLNEEVHIGLAVAIEEGLVVPVIHHAATLSLSEIARRRKELVLRAQNGKLRPQDLQGGTFTISNLGMYGVDAFNAIINAPQAAILAVGRIAERVVPINSQPAVVPMMILSLSCDHRVIDGARGAQFLSQLAELIEEPLGLLG
jgi:pyruvate dehydrogenase E2 component (dihydrolipoamide acetyltransferase)